MNTLRAKCAEKCKEPDWEALSKAELHEAENRACTGCFWGAIVGLIYPLVFTALYARDMGMNPTGIIAVSFASVTVVWYGVYRLCCVRCRKIRREINKREVLLGPSVGGGQQRRGNFTEGGGQRQLAIHVPPHASGPGIV